MNKVLEARERRSSLIQNKLKETNSNLISIKANVIGVDKNPYYAYLIVNVFLNLLIKKVKAINYSFYESLDGPFYLVETSEDGLFLKQISVDLEMGHLLGRLVDIDVHTLNSQIRRSDLGLGLRKCLICSNPAVICIRNNSHSLLEISEKVNSLIRNYLAEIIRKSINQAITKEADLDPKFGLVTKKSRGSHPDMDYNLLMKSKDAIISDLVEMFFLGFSNELEVGFKKARILGLSSEAKMYEATKGVNTYKGLIFILGIVLVALGNAIKNNRNDLFSLVKEIGKDLVSEFEGDLATYGAYAYTNYGFLGARGEVFKGLTSVKSAKAKLKNFSAKNLTLTLIDLVGNVEDTVLLKRSKTIEKYYYYKNLVASINNYDLELINLITSECIQNKISFGGSADLLIATIFIKLIEEELGIIYE